MSSWKKVKLGDIANVFSGKGIKKSDYIEDGSYPIIGANGEIGRCNEFNNDKPVLTTGRVGTIGTIQKVYKAWITDNTLIIDLISSQVDLDYLYYIMSTADFKSITTGNAQPLVTAGRLKAIEIQIPDTIEDQKKIASILSKFDELISVNEFKASNLIKAKTKIMNDIFSGGLRDLDSINPEVFAQSNWVKVKLGDICDIKCGKIPAKQSVDNGEYPLFVAGGIDGRYDSYSYDCEGILTSRNGDVGITKYYNGKFAVSDHTFALTGFNTSVHSVKYVYHWMKCNYEYIHSLAHGTGIPGINTKDLGGIEILIPPTLQEQQQIANLLSSYDELINSKVKGGDTIRKMKAQLMSQIFTDVERERE